MLIMDCYRLNLQFDTQTNSIHPPSTFLSFFYPHLDAIHFQLSIMHLTAVIVATSAICGVSALPWQGSGSQKSVGAAYCELVKITRASYPF